MAFIPSPQNDRPHGVALRVREPSTSVFPAVRDEDLRRQEQERFASLPSTLNRAVLDRHPSTVIQCRSDAELGGFTRCNGNIIAPAPIPYRPWEPKQYGTRESWQKDSSVFSEIERQKQQQVELMQKSRNYADYFSKQPMRRDAKAMVASHIQLHKVPDDEGVIDGFRGLGQFSPESHHGKAHVEVAAAKQTTVPPWLQQQNSNRSPHRAVNPSMVSVGVCDVFGLPPRLSPPPHTYDNSNVSAEYRSSSSMGLGESPSRGVADKGAWYPKEKHHNRKLFHIPDSTGGRPSPAGARMPGRQDTTVGDSYRLDALSVGRANTSMLP